MEEIKTGLITAISITMAYFSPIQDMVFTIFFLFLVNCVVGMLTGMMVEKESFSLRKFWRCILETLAFYVIVVSLFVCGNNLHNTDGALHAIAGVIYSILYFYSVNVLRNLTKCMPESEALLFLYYVVSFEFVRKFSNLKGFSQWKEERKKDDVNG